MHEKHVLASGKKTEEADKALIMIHGRGASADDILSLSPYLHVKEFAILAPQATGRTWYPYSFLAPQDANEPWLSSALEVIGDIVNDVVEDGISSSNIFILGFSQGACLTLEFAARNAARYGGIVAFTGGLIGDKIEMENYRGDFNGTPIFIGTSNPDPHVPVERVLESVNILKAMNGMVTHKVYDNMGHTINEDEISNANKLIFGQH